MSTPLQYRICGSDLQFVEIVVRPGEAVVGEPGAMMYMDEALDMETVLGDGRDIGLGGRLFGAFKRLFTGESMFSTLFSNNTDVPLRVAFASETPGKIMALDLATHGGTVIAQKGAFMCGARGVQVGVAFKKRLRVGFFGGEGFIMQKLTGEGIAFINTSGTLMEVMLEADNALKVDTGCLAALQTSVTYDIRYVGKLKSALFGGEGLFFAHLQGPGKVWLQSLPIRRLSRSILAQAMPGRGSPAARLWYFLLIIIVVILSLMGESGGG